MASASSSTMKPLTPSSMTSGTEPRRMAITGQPQAIASIITRPNGSGQSIGNSSALAPDRKAGFCASLISPMNSTLASASSGSTHSLKYSASALSTLAATFSFTPHRPAIWIALDALLRRDAAEESEIVALLHRLRHQQLLGHAVIDGRRPAHIG